MLEIRVSESTKQSEELYDDISESTKQSEDLYDDIVMLE